jgi:hypothetical protein
MSVSRAESAIWRVAGRGLLFALARQIRMIGVLYCAVWVGPQGFPDRSSSALDN